MNNNNTRTVVDEVQTAETIHLLETLLTRAYTVAVTEEISEQLKLRSVYSGLGNDDNLEALYAASYFAYRRRQSRIVMEKVCSGRE